MPYHNVIRHSCGAPSHSETTIIWAPCIWKHDICPAVVLQIFPQQYFGSFMVVLVVVWWYIMTKQIMTIISYLGMKSWDLHVCDRASTITHVDRVKKSNPWYNKIWLCLDVTIWSSQICLSVIFIHFVMIQNIWEKKLHLFTLFSITRHCFSLFLVGSKSMLALLPFKLTITPRHWNDKCFHRADGDLICGFCIYASHFQCIVGAQQEILCLTVRTTWLIWRVWPRSLGMSVPEWQRHREVE